MNYLVLFAQAQKGQQPPNLDAAAGAAAGFFIFVLLLELAIAAVMFASWWVLFTKAGEPGWAAIVPIYNIIVLIKISGKPLWWIVIWIICFPVALIVIGIGVAKNFGKDAAYGIGLALLAPIFYPMLAFGSAKFDPVEMDGQPVGGGRRRYDEDDDRPRRSRDDDDDDDRGRRR